MVISSSTPSPCVPREQLPGANGKPRRSAWNHVCILDKCHGLANNHASTEPKTMGFISASAKRVFFWTYPRTSWQWDVLCVLILVFIFLTPKSWFENTSFRRSHAAQTTIIVSADVVGAQLDRSGIERRAREISGRANPQVIEIREQRDTNGKLVAYEVDIR